MPVLLDESGELRTALGTRATPSAVLVQPDGRLRGGVANGASLVRRLLAVALADDETLLMHGVTGATTEGEPASSIDLGTVVAPRATVQRHDMGDKALLVDPVTGAAVTVDQVGALVWSVLDGSSRLDEIVADIADVFGAPVEVVGHDVLELVRSLGRAGLFEGIAAGADDDANATEPLDPLESVPDGATT